MLKAHGLVDLSRANSITSRRYPTLSASSDIEHNSTIEIATLADEKLGH